MKSLAPAFLLLFLLFFIAVPGQEKLAQHFTINNGLPNQSIRCIFKDSRGFIWLGTDAGLSRYNGCEFLNYSSKDGLANDKVWSITEDDEGNLILGCYGGGLSYFNGKKFTSIKEKEGLNLLYIRNLYFDKTTKALYAGTQDGIAIIYKKSVIKEVSRQLKNCTVELLVGGMFPKNKDTVFVSCLTNGNFYLCLKNMGISAVPQNDPLFKLSGYSFLSEDGEKIMSSAQGITKFKNGKVSVDLYPENMAQPTWAITKQNDTSYYMAAWGGGDGNSYGDIIHFNGKQYTGCKDKFGIKGVSFWSVYFDKNTNKLFIGTLAQGLFIVSLNPISYKTVSLPKEATYFNYFIDTKGSEWIITPKELHMGNKKISTSAFSSFCLMLNKKSVPERFKMFSDPNLTSDQIEKMIAQGSYFKKNPFFDNLLNKLPKIDSLALHQELATCSGILKKWKDYEKAVSQFMSFGHVFQDSKNNYWLTTTIGLFKIDPISITPLEYYDVGCLQFILKDKSNRIWCRQEYQLLNCIPDLNKPLQYLTFKRKKNYNVPVDVNIAEECPNGDVWLGAGNQGLFRYRNKVFKAFTRSNSFLESNDITGLCYTSKNQMFVGHPNGDIEICSVKDSLILVQKLDKNSGYTGTSIYDIKENKEGDIIIVTNKALVKFKYRHWLKTKELVFQNIDESDGFILETNAAAFNYNNSGIINLIDGNKNIAVDLNRLNELEYLKDTLYIENIQVNYANVAWDSIQKLKAWTTTPNKIELTHDQNFIEIFYNTINIGESSKNLFRYKMDGLTNQWSSLTNNKKILFTGLPPGTYKFVVQCINNFRKKGIQEATVEITILPPWWKTTAFYLILMFLTLFIHFGIVHLLHFSIHASRIAFFHFHSFSIFHFHSAVFHHDCSVFHSHIFVHHHHFAGSFNLIIKAGPSAM
ncbi:MAG: hypothetical protein H0W61_03545 [Bacteroidetes bacterium]|nr:hypothetical protein [Bacteroidota bacterium]